MITKREQESIFHKMQVSDQWRPYALFASWIDARRFCQDMANDEVDLYWRMRQRKGWYVVERSKREKNYEE